MGLEQSALMRAMVAEAGTIMGVDAAFDQLDLLRGDDGRLPDDVFRRSREGAEKSGAVGRPAGSGNKRTQALAKLIVQQHGDPVLSMARIYAMPLDQLCELLMIADGSRARERGLGKALTELAGLIKDQLEIAEATGMSSERVDKLEALLDRIHNDFRVLKAKPGELGLKALTLQRDSAREVAQYVHSKMPVAVDHNVRADVILNIPGLTDAAHLADYVGDAELVESDLERIEYSPFEAVPDEGEERDDGGDDGPDDDGGGL